MDVDREVTARLEREHYDRGVTVPLWLMATVFRASAVTRGQGEAPPASRSAPAAVGG